MRKSNPKFCNLHKKDNAKRANNHIENQASKKHDLIFLNLVNSENYHIFHSDIL